MHLIDQLIKTEYFQVSPLCWMPFFFFLDLSH